MKYFVDLNGERHEIELDGEIAKLGDTEVAASAEQLEGTPIRLVKIGDRVYRVVVRKKEARGQYTLWVEGHRFEAEALDERARAIRDITAATAKPTGPAPIVAPMPGLIVKVNVSVGDVIVAGHGAIVMEAMKMENELRSTAPGRVRAVNVSVGTPVEKGVVLVELE